MFETLKWVGDINGCIELIDQRLLPRQFEIIQCKTVTQLYDAIKTLTVRGAPAIGVAAAYGTALALQTIDAEADIGAALVHLNEQADYLSTSRPTAVNLFWALNRIKNYAAKYVADNPAASVSIFREAILKEANAICAEDQDMCRQIGINGEKFIKEGSSILTHCNAGALATTGQGTALSPMYEAKSKGRSFEVYVDETRPLLQGSRLTAWELDRAGIDVTVICDSMAGVLISQGKVDAIMTGADRIAANGDTANKIGTFTLSVLARAYNIPFYVAAPSSTFDLSIDSGGDIPIEQRSADEVTNFAGQKTAPDNIKVYNPAFDVTDAVNITAIITEKGIIENPTTEKIALHLK